MNEVAARGRPFPPGTSGNPNGRPVGSRTAFSAAFLRDLGEAWAEHGLAINISYSTQPATSSGFCFERKDHAITRLV